MTNFITLESSNEKDKPKKETEFKLLINIHDGPVSAFKEPSDYDNVLFIGHDIQYGDVFKAWNTNSQNIFTLYFGEKGDEFND